MRNDYSTRKTLGIVGLGIMGGAMAEAFWRQDMRCTVTIR
jgi:3-hydroxyisobutyrate dehydrogenase-like beta-hydroxyacid dehydrogenase